MKKVMISMLLLGQISCSKDSTTTTVTPSSPSVDVTNVAKAKFFNGVTVSTSGSSVVIKGNGLPDHKTPYWGVGNALYEDFPTGNKANVNTTMASRVYTMTIPASPTVAITHEETTLGTIGLALNGVPIFNDREGGNVALDAVTLTTFDASGAHPGPMKDYHYHTTGKYTSTDDAKLFGFLRDGFPIYGRKDKDGTYPSNLDTYGGHTSATTEFPEGIYHYHASNINYLNSGFYVLKAGSYYGTKGTLTN
jgi:hypothetical protein